MLLLSLLALVLMCALVPAVLFCINLRRYREPPEAGNGTPHVAVLIPARNEEANIESCVRHVLASHVGSLDVFVMDDSSTDRTAEIVQAIAAQDTRVRLLSAPSLPAGWNGKQHACWRLAHASEAPLLLFLDADVRLMPEALARMAAFQQQTGAALVSGFPRQITHTFLEWLLLPLIHFVLLGFLPIGRMRKSTLPGFAAGCGQFLLVQRESYFASGGHAAIRQTMHDGLRLPKLLREHGYKTDLADLTNLAEVRMYCSAGAVWNGLAKNATEGLAAPARIAPLTLLLLLGQVLPGLFFVWSALTLVSVLLYESVMGVGTHVANPVFAALSGMAIVAALIASYLPRLLATRRFRQPLKSALLHPVGILVLLAVQWYALTRRVLRLPIGWRARTYAPNGAGTANDL